MSTTRVITSTTIGIIDDIKKLLNYIKDIEGSTPHVLELMGNLSSLAATLQAVQSFANDYGTARFLDATLSNNLLEVLEKLRLSVEKCCVYFESNSRAALGPGKLGRRMGLKNKVLEQLLHEFDTIRASLTLFLQLVIM